MQKRHKYQLQQSQRHHRPFRNKLPQNAHVAVNLCRTAMSIDANRCEPEVVLAALKEYAKTVDQPVSDIVDTGVSFKKDMAPQSLLMIATTKFCETHSKKAMDVIAKLLEHGANPMATAGNTSPEGMEEMEASNDSFGDGGGAGGGGGGGDSTISAMSIALSYRSELVDIFHRAMGDKLPTDAGSAEEILTRMLEFYPDEDPTVLRSAIETMQKEQEAQDVIDEALESESTCCAYCDKIGAQHLCQKCKDPAFGMYCNATCKKKHIKKHKKQCKEGQKLQTQRSNDYIRCQHSVDKTDE